MAKPAPAVDLGALQHEFQASRARHRAAATKLAHAQDEFDRSKEAFETAQRALRDGARVVMG